MSKNIELLDGGLGVFSNILPATFVDSLTYIEQLKVIAEVLNKTVEVVNSIVDSGGSGYILPPATTENLGGIKVGDRLSISEDGVLSADEQGGVVDPYVLPIASEQVLGGIKVGQNLTIEEDGTLNAQVGGSYTLPVASGQVLGGIKVGQRLTIDENGVLSADEQGGGGGGSYTLPVASPTTLGGVYTPYEVAWAPAGFETANALQNQNGNLIVQVGKGITLNAEESVGYISVKIGSGLYFDEQGRLCATGGGGEVMTTGIIDEITPIPTQSEGSNLAESLNVGDSVNITKF